MSVCRLVKLSSITWMFAALAIVASACSTEPPPPVAAVPPAAVANTPTLAGPAISTGHELFIAKGCAACHGQNGEGTDFAPALPGHSAAQVKRQARAPLGLMPIFPPDRISNEELDAIAEFIDGLEGGHAHGRPPGSGDELTLHHWMALFALEAEDGSEATHHVRHIMELTEGQHLARMKDTISLIETGEIHEAGHVIETMLAGLEGADIDEATMHLKLALSSARVDEAVIAAHHVEHFLDTVTDHEHESGKEILDTLAAGELLEAVHGLERVLAGEFVSEPEHGPDHTEAHDEGEAHDDDEAHDDEAHDESEEDHSQ